VKPRQPTGSVPMPETMSSAVGGNPLAALSERVKRIGVPMTPHDNALPVPRPTPGCMCLCSRVVAPTR
jgi:hypothetical protein